ncbi:MAG: RNA polymerase sigma factor [Proteobacteria bacterium]|nr:RNA polymerase sigma factor [Pseudomonadota bacterium]
MSILQYCLRNRHLEQKLEICRNKMFRIAFSWCHDEMLADDLVQDALTKALLSLKQLKKPDMLESWVITILNNVWRDHLRRQKEFIDIDEYVHLSNEGPEYIHERERVIQRVRKAIGELPMGQRQVISLVDLEGLSYNEVSQVLEIPVGTVMSRLNRARNAMLEKLHNKNRVVYLHKQHSLEKGNV